MGEPSSQPASFIPFLRDRSRNVEKMIRALCFANTEITVCVCVQQYLSRHGVQTSIQMCLTFLYTLPSSRLHCSCSFYTQYTCYHMTCLSNTVHFRRSDIHLHGTSDDSNEALYQYGRVPIPWTMRPSTHIQRVLQKIHDPIHNFDYTFHWVLVNLFVLHCMMVWIFVA
jgi:hypothetical protein